MAGEESLGLEGANSLERCQIVPHVTFVGINHDGSDARDEIAGNHRAVLGFDEDQVTRGMAGCVKSADGHGVLAAKIEYRVVVDGVVHLESDGREFLRRERMSANRDAETLADALDSPDVIGVMMMSQISTRVLPKSVFMVFKKQDEPIDF